MGLLLPELNFIETRKKVDEFLRKDFQRLILMSGRNLTDLRSPSLSLAPGHSNGSNGIETSIVQGLDAELFVRAIHHTIYHLPETSKIIMKDTYIYQMRSWQIAKALNYEHSQFNHVKTMACLYFADGFDYWQKRLNCDPPIDLHVYEPEDNRKDTGIIPAN